MNTLMRIVLLGLTLVVGAVRAFNPLVISSGTDRATPLLWCQHLARRQCPAPEDMAEIIGNDLRNSGVFEPRRNMISLPTQASEIDLPRLAGPRRSVRIGCGTVPTRSFADQFAGIQRHLATLPARQRRRWR
jgi:hypothetical protein